MSNKQVETMNIKELCNSGKYIVPIYQRNYAWGKDEIDTLISDILSAPKGKNYYIGSLVVAKRGDGYEVIDGQQRLTTLKLLLSYYNKSENINLTFEHRDESNVSLENLSESNSNYENNIDFGYKFILENQELKNKKDEFFKFLLDNVVILRTEVPKDTELNHYFEIMNNRGEQLEKHEILKAQMMSKLTDKDKEYERKLFALIWDACSDMNVYAIKHFPPKVREILFDEYCNSIPSIDLLKISEKSKGIEYFFNPKVENAEKRSEIEGGCEQGSKERNILKLLEGNQVIVNERSKSNPKYDEIRDGQYNSIIDFPNFLMMVIKIYTVEDVKLNDKFLLEESKTYMNYEESDSNKIMNFIFCLLKCRLIFDTYIIKTRQNDENWLLRRLKKYKDGNFKEVETFGSAFENNDLADDNQEFEPEKYHKHIVQILSMFHTSFRQKINKNWLFDVLKELYNLYNHTSLEKTYSLTDSGYLAMLERIANKYYQERKNNVSFENGGQSIPNYIFNYLDYLLWKKGDGNDEFLKNSEFRFSLSRTSVEHYLPQNKADILLDSESALINDFGNLCLISPHQNSALSDNEPSSKREWYKDKKRFECGSLKQALMLKVEKWDADAIKAHKEYVMDILESESEKYPS